MKLKSIKYFTVDEMSVEFGLSHSAINYRYAVLGIIPLRGSRGLRLFTLEQKELIFEFKEEYFESNPNEQIFESKINFGHFED